MGQNIKSNKIIKNKKTVSLNIKSWTCKTSILFEANTEHFAWKDFRH